MDDIIKKYCPFFMLNLIKFDDDQDDISFKKSKINDKTLGSNYIINDIEDLLTRYIDNDKISKEDREKLKNSITLLEKVFKHKFPSKYHVRKNDDLEDIIKKILEFCDNDADLNWIDTHEVTDMSDVFNETDFIGNISEWNTSNVKTMARMFRHCPFNGNIENWDTQNVENLSFMFQNNENFNRDLSKWNTEKVKTMQFMAANAINFNKASIENWNYRRCKDKYNIFGK